MSTTTRFAPSPTGLLHLGHARSALIGWQRARAAGGRFLLRFEDIDATRSRAEFVHRAIADLQWLGLDWDAPPRLQSRHLGEYRTTLTRLAAGGLTYPCFCTRAEIVREVAAAGAAPHGPDGAPVYPGTCRALSRAERIRRLAAGSPYALRLDIQRAIGAAGRQLTFEEEAEGTVICDPAPFGDVVLARKDVPASYHLCVTQDDALQGVTLVTRGEDLLAATHLHRLLQALMGWPAPAYAHHTLLTDAEGRRLAKRDGARTLRSLREAGCTPAQVRVLAGVAPEPGHAFDRASDGPGAAA